MNWYNYETQQFDFLPEMPQTDRQAMQYLPQWPAAQGLFRVLRLQNHSILDAMREVLQASLHTEEKKEHA